MADSVGVEQASPSEIKRDVRDFYDSVGWKEIGEGLYQNARYEDLRPVSRDYIHQCHMRVKRFLPNHGDLMLDAGSGPIQYPEYLEYSSGFRKRVCFDISLLALKEARNRIGEHGLFVVGDIANLPFRSGAFNALVSLHTVHHLPEDEHLSAFRDFNRVLAEDGRAVIVYSWGDRSLLVRLARWPMLLANRTLSLYQRIRKKDISLRLPSGAAVSGETERLIKSAGTFTYKHGYAWIMDQLDFLPDLEVRVWRTMSTAMLRAFVHGPLGGRGLLKLIFWLEDRSPHFLGRIGQYPMILFHSHGSRDNA